MTKQKIYLIAGGVSLLLVLGAWFLVAHTFLSGDPKQLQNNTTNTRVDVAPVIEPIANPNNQKTPIQEQFDQNKDQDTFESVGVISLGVPAYINTAALQELTEKINLDEKNNITLEITQAKTHEEYVKMIQQGSSSFDLLLLPVGWTSATDYSSLPFSDEIHSLFHPVFSQVMKESDMRWIPFAFDPVITIAEQAIDIDDYLTWKDIEVYLYSNISDWKTPLGFGISDSDVKLLQAGRHPLPGQETLLDLFISSSIATNNGSSINSLRETSLWDLQDTVENFSSLDASCEDNASVCLFNNDLTQVAFSSYSTYKGFDTDIPSTLYPLPDQRGLTAQGLGFVVPDSAQKDVVLGRLIGYLQEAPISNIALRDTTLSAFNEVLSTQILESEFKYLRKYIQNNEVILLKNNPQGLQYLLDTTPLLQVLEGDYSARVYIEELSEE